MIISFSVSNFRSFKQEQTLSMIASGRVAGDHPSHVVREGDLNVLRTAVIYGANGAGKSNLIKALAYFKDLLTETREKTESTERVSFLPRTLVDRSTSDFDLQFTVNGRVYQVGLKVDDNRIAEEWLVEITGGVERILYERTTGVDLEVTVALSLENPPKRLAALAEVGGRPNQSFLATVISLLGDSDNDSEFISIANWLTSDLVVISPDEAFRPIGVDLTEDPTFQAFASDFLRAASTGIDDLKAKKEKISEAAIKGLIPESHFSGILRELDKPGNKYGFIIGAGDGNEISLSKDDAPEFHRFSVTAVHGASSDNPVELPLSEESDGTRRLLNLLPALYKLRERDAVFIIDELNRSLHPLLVRQFITYFLECCGERRHQLISTTHESDLLNQNLLRRDEIWFAEKNSSGSTQLFSLDDFGIRKDLEIRKHYLQGRFGAIPQPNGISHLLTPSV